MALLILRVLFISVAAGIATLFFRVGFSGPAYLPYLVIAGLVLLSLGVIAIDIFTPRKQIEVISATYFGLLVGFLLTYILWVAFGTAIPSGQPLCPTHSAIDGGDFVLRLYEPFAANQGRLPTFIIPYVEFSRDLKGLRPVVLDTSSIIDGRLAELADTNIIDSQVVMPSFVLAELQAIADSNDRLRHTRGRRGLDILNKLRAHPKIDFQIYDRELP